MVRVLEIEDLPIRLTADGRWLHGEAPMHPRVADLFSRCLVPEPSGGWHLEVGPDRAPVEVADTGFFVRSMRLEQAEDGTLLGVHLVLSDGSQGPLDADTLEISDAHVLYCRIVRHGLSLPCRFPPSLYHRLALHVEEAEGGFALRVGGVLHRIVAHDPKPRPA